MRANSRYLFIFNPAADKGRASRKAEWLKRLLVGREDSLLVTTTHAGHAGEIALTGIGESTCMIACGGDGTLHEVVNAVAGQGITVGVLPIGSANDFLKTLDPRNIPHPGIDHFFDGATRSVDLGRVAFGLSDRRYFVNSLGIGFTGRIAKSVRGRPWLRGELGYAYALLHVLSGYRPLKMHITITLEDSLLELHESVFAFSVANGKIEGGKFRIAPHAELSDGLLDVALLRAMPKYEFFRYVVKYIKGSHISDKRVLYCKAKAVEVRLEEPDVMHLDGEVYDGIHGRIAISVLPGALSVRCGHDSSG